MEEEKKMEEEKEETKMEETKMKETKMNIETRKTPRKNPPKTPTKDLPKTPTKGLSPKTGPSLEKFDIGTHFHLFTALSH